jgi:hypothetical protein
MRFPIYVMDFDHVNGGKKFGISGHRHGFKGLIEEIKKCDVVCANCHRIRTLKTDPRLKWMAEK